MYERSAYGCQADICLIASLLEVLPIFFKPQFHILVKKKNECGSAEKEIHIAPKKTTIKQHWYQQPPLQQNEVAPMHIPYVKGKSNTAAYLKLGVNGEIKGQASEVEDKQLLLCNVHWKKKTSHLSYILWQLIMKISAHKTYKQMVWTTYFYKWTVVLTRRANSRSTHAKSRKTLLSFYSCSSVTMKQGQS